MIKRGGPTDKGKPCVFPFIFNGKEYEKCKKWGGTGVVSWCATKTSKNGTLVVGKWGFCNKNCPGSITKGRLMFDKFNGELIKIPQIENYNKNNLLFKVNL